MASRWLVTSLLAFGAAQASPLAKRSASKIIWGGRVPPFFTPKDFENGDLSPYDPSYVHGSQNWSHYIRLPNVQPSLFDVEAGGKTIEVTIDDTSIFNSGGDNPQVGFRRSELLPVPANASSNVLTEGKRAIHWSVRADPHLPLNFTHEYQNVFLETSTYDAHQFTMKTGTPYDNATMGEVPATRTLRIESSTNGGVAEKTLFETEYTVGDWHNFALELDFDDNTLAGYYSKNNHDLALVIPTTANNNTGNGQYHFGIIKLPASGTGDGNVPFSGFQESNIHEVGGKVREEIKAERLLTKVHLQGQYYGGIFIEDTSRQSITLKTCRST